MNNQQDLLKKFIQKNSMEIPPAPANEKRLIESRLDFKKNKLFLSFKYSFATSLALLLIIPTLYFYTKQPHINSSAEIIELEQYLKDSVSTFWESLEEESLSDDPYLAG